MARDKKVYTYEQLDSILRKRGKSPNDLGIKSPNNDRKLARLYGSVFVECSWHFRYLTLVRNPGKMSDDGYFRLATVESVAGGDTLYKAIGFGGARNHGEPKEKSAWRRLAHRLTPYSGRAVNGEWWYRVRRDGTWAETHASPARSLMYPTCAMPKGPTDWATSHAINDLPAFTARAKRFARTLRKSLDGCFGAQMQLLWRGHGIPYRIDQTAMAYWLHVCMPPADGQETRRLLVAIRMHDADSRRLFHVDGDYAVRHCQFLANPNPDRSGRKYDFSLRWKCQKDAIVGIREWTLGSLHIPGPDS